MKRLRLALRLDRTMLPKVAGYYLYRSDEKENEKPIVDGMYIQRETVGERPPQSVMIVLEW